MKISRNLLTDSQELFLTRQSMVIQSQRTMSSRLSSTVSSRTDLNRDMLREFLLSMALAPPASIRKVSHMVSGQLTSSMVSSPTPKAFTREPHVLRISSCWTSMSQLANRLISEVGWATIYNFLYCFMYLTISEAFSMTLYDI